MLHYGSPAVVLQIPVDGFILPNDKKKISHAESALSGLVDLL